MKVRFIGRWVGRLSGNYQAAKMFPQKDSWNKCLNFGRYVVGIPLSINVGTWVPT